MATPQQKFYKNNREKVLAYKKEHYAKKSNKMVIDLFKNIQLKGKTKSESRKMIKNAIEAGNIVIKYVPPDAQHAFEEYGIGSRTSWTPQEWIRNERSLIRIDQNTIVVEYRENATYDFREEPCDREVLEIIFEPWMLITPMTREDE